MCPPLHTHKQSPQSNQKILNTATQLNFEKELTSVTVKITVHTTNTPDHLSKITVALKKDTSNQNQTGQGSYFCHHTPRVYDVRHIGSKSILEEYFYLLLSMFSRNNYLALIRKLKNQLHTYMKICQKSFFLETRLYPIVLCFCQAVSRKCSVD